MFTLPVCLSVCGSVRNPDLALHTTVLIRLFWNFTYMLDVESSLCKIIFRILGQRSRSPKGQKRVFGHISETNSRRESGRVSNCRGN